MNLPRDLFVMVEGEGKDEFLNAQADASAFANPNETITVTLYRKVGTVKISAPVQVTPVKIKS